MNDAPNNPDALAAAGIELSERLAIAGPNPQALPVWRDLLAVQSWLKEARAVCLKPPPNLVKAAEWLLDNERQVERTIRQVNEDLPPQFYARLARLSGPDDAGLPRAFAIAHGLLRASHLQVSLAGCIEFIEAYQRRAKLTIAELWAFPTMLRLACIELLLAGFERLVSELRAPFALSRLAREPMALEASECVARSIANLAVLSTIPWKDFFDRTSAVEAILQTDPAGVYGRMDFESRDLYRKAVESLALGSGGEEPHIAAGIVERVRRETGTGPARLIGYWLNGQGRPSLERELGFRPTGSERWNRWLLDHAGAIYATLLTVASVTVLAVPATLLANAGAGWLATLGGLLVSAIPASVVAVGIAQWIVTLVVPPRRLTKLDFTTTGIAEDCTTAVIVPVIVARPSSAAGLMERLELHRLANPDPSLHFVVLSDVPDAAAEVVPADEAIVASLVAGITTLNHRYGRDGTGPFYLLHRARRFNPGEGVFMGWERKRGKIEQFNDFVATGDASAFPVAVGNLDALRSVRFVVTVDADTNLPPGSVAKLVGAVADPANAPTYDPASGRVMSGYTIVQPRVEVGPDNSARSIFAEVYAGDTAIDIYSRVVSNVYQDLFGEGIFAGKGVYDLASFRRSCGGIPDDSLLSHDLFEGIKGRAALASDIVLYENFPASYIEHARRWHRWVRGDWQLMPWLFGAHPAASDEPWRPSGLDRWKIIDNLRRSLIPSALVLLLAAGWLVLPGSPWAWTLLAIAAPGFYAVTDLVAAIAHGRSLRGTGHSLYNEARRWLLGLVFVANEAVVAVDAIGRTLWRVFRSGRGLLEWVPASEVAADIARGNPVTDAWRRMAPAPVLAIVLGAAIAILRSEALVPALPLLLAWIASPQIAALVSRPRQPLIDKLADDDRLFLRRLARRTWLFFETFVGPEDNWLPPDNFQELPRREVDHRTSPTNIGLMFVSSLAAWDLGYVGVLDLATRLVNGLDALDRMAKFQGHLFNWYESRSLAALEPRYVSTVDSGNLAVSLVLLRQASAELAASPVLARQRWDGLADTVGELVHSLGPLASAAANAAIAALTARVNGARNDPRAWRGAIIALSEVDFPAAQSAIAAAVATADRKARPSALQDVQVWLERVNHHLVALRRTFDLLMPWMALLPSAPAACAELAGRVEATLGPESALASDASPLLAELAQTRTRGGEIAAWADNVIRAIEVGRQEQTDVVRSLADVAARSETLAFAMDFRFLFDREQRLFHIGYNVSAHRIDPNHYDLLATEARLASYFAIAKGDVPYEHWFHLSRPIMRAGSGVALASWNGSMFEYLMPALFLPSIPDTLLGRSERAAVDAHRRHGDLRGIPWGVSESAYAGIDSEGHFRYRAFGVPELGLRRDLIRDLVVTPYATALALTVRPTTATANLRVLEREGLLSRYGLIEAADYTPRRVPSGERYAPVGIFMAHHQGMSLAALDNALTDGALIRRFMADPRMRSVELLLRERVPWEAPKEAARQTDDAPPPGRKASAMPAAWRPTPSVGVPQVQSLGNGSLATWISDAGGGGISWRGHALTRWLPDSTRDAHGLWIYLTDGDSGESWSATRQPSASAAGSGEAVFHPHMAEFTRREQGIAVRLEVGVAPHDDIDIRRLSITNESDRPRRLRITSYAEVALAPPRQDERHPLFSKMFVSGEFLPSLRGLLFQRRPRDPREAPAVMIHRVVADDRGVEALSYETDRRAFLGRNGSNRQPRALTEGLTGTTGFTLDPVMALDATVELEPGAQRQLAFLTMAAGSRESVLELAARYATLPALDWAFTDAVADVSREWQALDLPPGDVADLQRLGSLLIYPHAALRGPPAAIAANRIGQPGLWGMGLSGDFPIVLVRTSDPKDTVVLRTLVHAHGYWRKRGLVVDLVVMRTGASAYEEPMRERVATLLQEAEAQAQYGRRGGIHVVFSDQIGIDQVRLLESVARAILDEGRPLGEQVAAVHRTLRPLPRFEPPNPPPRIETPSLPRRTDLAFDNGYGGFSPDGREYIVHWTDATRPPVPWCNVIANPEFGSIVSEAGIGFSWALNSGENRLTPWSNDPVVDPPGEAIYLRDEETADVWSPTPLPAGGGSAVEVHHGAGYTTWRRQSHGLAQSLKVFVPPDDPVKVARLTLRNLTDRTRRMTATYYAEWVLGALGSAARPQVVAEFMSEWPALIARNPWIPDFAERVAFLVSSAPVHDFTTDRQDFLGREGDLAMPRALTRWGLGRGVHPGTDACAAYQVHIDLPPGEEADVIFVLGQGKDRAEAEALARKWQSREVTAVAEAATDAYWDKMLGAVTVRTPDPAFDVITNRWLLYQSRSSRVFARAGFQQASGAFGFRDQLQDVLALMWADPALARAHILTSAAHQFEEGDVLHWWHPPGGQGVRTRCSDDLLWLPYATAAYVKATGDTSILEESVRFLSAPPLTPDEHDRYSRFPDSAETATLLEHCQRALARGATRGPHGLPLIGGGDWNDGMDRIGPKGRGESVWLAWFIIATIDAFIDVYRRIERPDLVARWQPRAAEIRRAVESTAWDGNWYVRAFDDDGRPWGTSAGEECRIDSISQSWSVLADGDDPERSRTAVISAWRELERGEGIVRLLWPPFSETGRDPGYIKSYPPGVRENGGQYAHAAAWLGLAFTRLGDGDAALRLFTAVNPVERAGSQAAAERYRVEPYAIAADVAGADPRVGQGGWTWYTGSAAWTWRLAIEGMLGLRLRDGKLTVAPALPADWPWFEADIAGPRGRIAVRVDNPDGIPGGLLEMVVDGAKVPPGSPIQFPTDGSTRRVAVRIRTAESRGRVRRATKP